MSLLIRGGHDPDDERPLRHRRRRRVDPGRPHRRHRGRPSREPHDRVIDARGGYVLPGLIQTHIHLCQTLFRGFADDLPLMDWLRTRVWPMEAAHTPDTLRAAARLATTELLASGTTAVLTMETVHDTDVVFEAVAASGMRATIGKCMMDFDAAGAEAAPGGDARVDRREPRASARGGTAPKAAGCARRSRRGSPCRARASCSRRSRTCPIDSTRWCTRMRRNRATRSRSSGRCPAACTNMEYLASLRLASPHLCAAHCVWVDDRDQQIAGGPRREGDALPRVEPEARLRHRAGARDARARHHGVARRRRRRLQQPPRHVRGDAARRGAAGDAEAARACCRRATCCGWRRGPARARSASRTRSDRSSPASAPTSSSSTAIGPRLAPGPDPYSTLVYAARGSDVRTTIVDGEVLVNDFAPAARRPGGAGRRGPCGRPARGRPRRHSDARLSRRHGARLSPLTSSSARMRSTGYGAAALCIMI